MARFDPEKGLGFTFWLSICAGAAVAMLVNQLEQPFARSLVVCDTPVDTTLGAPKPLSKRCGDRLFVIGEGARLSAQGHSLEQTCKIFSTVMVGCLIDIYGRKPFFVWSLGLLFITVLMYIWATFDQSNAKTLFVIAQGMQGMGAGDVLGGIVFADIAVALSAKAGADAYARRDQIGGLTAFLSFFSAQIVAGLELEDYRGLWLGMSCLMLFVLVPVAVWFPETMVKKKDGEEATLSVAQRFTAEMGGYKRIFLEKRIVGWSLLEKFLSAPLETSGGMWGAYMMAYFGYTQQMLVLRFFPFVIIMGLCAPLVNNHCKQVGYTRGFWRAMIALKVAGFTLFPLLTIAWWMPFLGRLFYLSMGGFGGVWTTTRARLVGTEMNAKYESLQFLTVFVSQAIANYIHQLLFDENATTLWQQVKSTTFFPTFFNILNAAVMIFVIFPRCRETLASMDAELAAEGDSSGDAKHDEKKKD